MSKYLLHGNYVEHLTKRSTPSLGLLLVLLLTLLLATAAQAAEVWKSTGSLATARQRHTATLLDDDRFVLVVAGTDTGDFTLAPALQVQVSPDERRW